jgi:hypothetical protein
MFIRSTVACLLQLAPSCGGSEKKATDPAGQKTHAEGLDAGPIPKEDAPPAKAAPTVELSAEDKRALDRMEQLASEMLSAVQKAGKDCDKMASNLNKFVDANGAELKKLSQSFEKAPEGKKAKLDQEMQTRMKSKSDAILPSLLNCKEHEGVGKVFERLDTL